MPATFVHSGGEMEGQLGLLLVAMVQAVGAVAPEKVDLTIPQPCGAAGSTGEEIVVCARRGDELSPYRITQTPAPRPGLPKAEVQIADGVNIAGETEQADVGGFPSNRVMVRLKIKF